MFALNFFWNACRGAMTTIATENVIEMIILVSTVSNFSIESLPESISKSFKAAHAILIVYLVVKDARTPSVIARLDFEITPLEIFCYNFFQDYQDDATWQTCTQFKCPVLTNCIFGCDSDECLLDCVREYKTAHEDCPCEVKLIFKVFVNFKNHIEFSQIAHMDVLVTTMSAKAMDLIEIRISKWSDHSMQA